jgi:hypothetical protein
MAAHANSPRDPDSDRGDGIVEKNEKKGKDNRMMAAAL